MLDIDETLAWTVGHWFKELQSTFGNPENLTPEEMILKYKYAQHVPYWQKTEADEWMENARNDDSLHTRLPLIEGAADTVRQINESVPIVGYLTIRPTAVIEGTRTWLINNDFPQADILARPPNIPTVQGNHWKAEVLHFLYPQVLGIVDDSPTVATQLPKDYPGTLYHFDSSGPRSITT